MREEVNRYKHGNWWGTPHPGGKAMRIEGALQVLTIYIEDAASVRAILGEWLEDLNLQAAEDLAKTDPGVITAQR